MKNSDQPANPTLTYNTTSGNPNGHYLGLSKREYFAIMAMQGLLASNPPYQSSVDFASLCAHEARKMADALLAELDSTKKISE